VAKKRGGYETKFTCINEVEILDLNLVELEGGR
jgi:hypothetical protein